MGDSVSECEKDQLVLSNFEQAASVSDFDRVGIADTSSRRGSVPILGKRGLLLLSWLAPVTLVIVWELLAEAGWIAPQILPAPSKVLHTAIKLATTGSLLNDLGVSLLRVITGFLIGASVGTSPGTGMPAAAPPPTRSIPKQNAAAIVPDENPRRSVVIP